MESGDDTLSPLAAVQAELAKANRKVLLDDQLLDALHSFEQIMSYRNEMYLRLSHRVRATVRGGMAVFALVGIAMFLLLVTLVMQVEHARNSTALLAQHVDSVADDMLQIESTMLAMENRMRLFGSIGEYMHVMTGQTGVIAGGMMAFVTAINELSSSIILYVGDTVTMPVRIYLAVLDGEFGTAAALSTLLLVSTGVAVFMVLRVSQSKEGAFL